MPGPRTARSTLSALLLAAAVGLFALAALLWYRGRGDGETDPPVPVAAPGKNELVHVTSALDAQGVDVETLPGTGAVRSKMLEGVGQPLTLDGVAAYAFVYQPDAAARDEATLDVLPGEIDLEDNAGDPVEPGELQLVVGSNVALVLVGADDDLLDRATAALGSLP